MSHWKVAYYLFNMKFKDSPEWRWYCVKEKTVKLMLLLFYCLAWASLRHSLWCSPELQLEDFREMEFRGVLQFIDEVNKRS